MNGSEKELEEAKGDYKEAIELFSCPPGSQ